MNISDEEIISLSPFCKCNNYKTISQQKNADVINIPYTKWPRQRISSYQALYFNTEVEPLHRNYF